MIFKIKVNIIDYKNSLKDLYNETKNLGYKNPLIICDKIFFKDSYILKNIIKFKKKKFIEFKNEPTYEQLNNEINDIKKMNLDCIIGIGGGSTIDFAKGIALLYRNKGSSIKYMGFPKNLNNPLPVIAIPTTTSTGSEVIYNAVFTHQKNKKKLGINTELNYPVLSILDSNIIKRAPKKIIYQSGIASLLRSIETYTSVDSNEITKFFSLKSFDMLSNALLSRKKNETFYKKLQWGCIFSMFSLSNSSGGPCGVINYYLSSNYNISQPLAYSLSAIEFFRNNINKGYRGYDELFEMLNKNAKVSYKLKSKNFINKLEKILSKNSKYMKKAKSVLKKDVNFDQNVFKSFKNFNFLPLTKNPIKVSKKDLMEIIKRVKN